MKNQLTISSPTSMTGIEMTKTYSSRSEFFEDRLRQMAQEIAKLPKSDVLNIDEDEYIDYLESKFSLTPIKVNRDMEEIREPRKYRERHNVTHILRQCMDTDEIPELFMKGTR